MNAWDAWEVRLNARPKLLRLIGSAALIVGMITSYLAAWKYMAGVFLFVLVMEQFKWEIQDFVHKEIERALSQYRQDPQL